MRPAIDYEKEYPGALMPTPSQTVGPYFGFALPWADGPFVVAEGTAGAIRLEGVLLDGAGEPVPDGMIETWQADGDGRFAHPDDPRGAVAWSGFRGFGRCATDAQGRYSILTVKPGPVPGPGSSEQAPHITMSVFARGMLQRLVTRVYFADEEERNSVDPVLCSLRGEEEMRRTLKAEPIEGGYRFDIRLQGQDETVFFAI
jgi:protocatechuate 3,4-dioxygenase, alpha subunit